MAKQKKPRTPAPPRPVQAPKKRTDAKMSGEDRRKLLYLVAFAAVGVVALAVVLGFLLTRGNGSGGLTATQGPAVPANLPGQRTGPAPWDAGYEGLPDRLLPIGLSQLPSEAFDLHIHVHVDIFVDGKKVKIPANIGIFGTEFITELHTHQGDPGIIHVEAPQKKTFSLGQFLGVWGVRVTKNCIGGYCATPGKPLRVYVNGKLVKGDWTRLGLKSHQEIAIVYGKPPKQIPKTWKFAANE